MFMSSILVHAPSHLGSNHVLMMTLIAQFEEILLIKSSLLPGESFAFEDDDEGNGNGTSDGSHMNYSQILEALSQTGVMPQALQDIPPKPLTFSVTSCSIAITLTLGVSYPENPLDWRVSIHGDRLSRPRQEQWDKRLKDRSRVLVENEESNAMYQLLCDYALPLIAEEATQTTEPDVQAPVMQRSTAHPSTQPFHALLSSHHLISPQKRKSLLKWSQELAIGGFAKVGYPGIIYAEGKKEDVEDFVQRVKEMQWLALRVRFVEPIEGPDVGVTRQEWTEVTKVGEAIELMRKRGREKLIIGLGFGAGD
ncbi:hypothetical protein FRB90_009140 [Tulasnella sp. 427]|nr:hypothetical protein FRB90_009140 [Tulasnella sp. 427]